MGLSGRLSLARAAFSASSALGRLLMSKAKGRWVGSGARVLWEPGAVSELIFPGCIQALGPETGTVK